jgi:hypothetical protein
LVTNTTSGPATILSTTEKTPPTTGRGPSNTGYADLQPLNDNGEFIENLCVLIKDIANGRFVLDRAALKPHHLLTWSGPETKQ